MSLSIDVRIMTMDSILRRLEIVGAIALRAFSTVLLYGIQIRSILAVSMMYAEMA